MRPGFGSDRGLDLDILMLTLLSGHLAGLRDRLALDGFYPAAELVADLTEITNDYLTHPPAESCDGAETWW